MKPTDKQIQDAWEQIHHALRNAMHDIDAEVLAFIADRAEGNAAIVDAAADELDNRREQLGQPS